MKKLFLTLILLTYSTIIFSQKTNTDWLANHLNKLVINDEDDDRQFNINGNKTKPVFSFVGNKMLMNINTKDEDFSMKFNLSWLLKDVRKVSYKRQKNGNYELFLDVPADRIKVDLGFGKDNTIGGSFNVKDKNSDSNTSFTLSTKDENVVKEIIQHFESAIKVAQR